MIEIGKITMNKKIFFIFLTLITTTFYNYHAGILDIFKKKTEEQKAAEEAELRKFVDVLRLMLRDIKKNLGLLNIFFEELLKNFLKNIKKK
jgi:hypothetical protein